jgi:hypothetical protein
MVELVMTKLEQIEQSILDLSPDELKAFTDWFETVREQNFDAAIERDARAGKLDRLAEKALAEFNAGRTRAL